MPQAPGRRHTARSMAGSPPILHRGVDPCRLSRPPPKSCSAFSVSLAADCRAAPSGQLPLPFAPGSFSPASAELLLPAASPPTQHRPRPLDRELQPASGKMASPAVFQPLPRVRVTAPCSQETGAHWAPWISLAPTPLNPPSTRTNQLPVTVGDRGAWGHQQWPVRSCTLGRCPNISSTLAPRHKCSRVMVCTQAAGAQVPASPGPPWGQPGPSDGHQVGPRAFVDRGQEAAPKEPPPPPPGQPLVM